MEIKELVQYAIMLCGVGVSWGFFKKTVDGLEKTAGEQAVRLAGIESLLYLKIDNLDKHLTEKIEELDDRSSSAESRINVTTMRVDKLEKYIGELYDKLNKLDLIAAAQAENNRNRESQMDVVFKKLDSIYEMLAKRA